jgi:hypothetical protein
MPLASRPSAEQVLRLDPVVTLFQLHIALRIQEPLAFPARAHPMVQPRRQRHRELVAVFVDVPEPE